METRDLKGGKKIYCKVYLDKEKKFKTEVVKKVKGDNDQAFDETPRLLVLQKEVPVKEAVFQVWNKGALTSEYIGTVSMAVSELVDGVPRDEWYVLKNNKGTKDRGEIHLQVMYLEPGDDLTKERHEFAYPLQTLLRKGKLTPWMLMLEQSPDLDKPDHNGSTALVVAAELAMPEQVDILLKRSADITVANKEGETAAHAAAGSDAGCLKLLLAAKADVGKEDAKGNRPLHAAAANDKADSIKLLLEAGADIDAQNKEGNTALHVALITGSIEAVKALVEAKAGLFIENDEKLTPCTLSVKVGVDNEEVRDAYFKAINVCDEREFPLKKELGNRVIETRAKLEHGEGTWQNNPQLRLKAPTGSTCKVLMFYDDPVSRTTLPMEKCGFLMFNDKGEHKQVTYWHDCLHYGQVDPLEIAFTEESPSYTIIPFSKGLALAGDWSIIVYSESEEVTLRELSEWKHRVSRKGEWKGSSAGGCIEHKTFSDNPTYKLKVPKEAVKVMLHLEQGRNMADVEPFKIIPYRSFIGFYTFEEGADLALDEPLHKLQKWKNAREVCQEIEIDGSKNATLTLIVGTYKPNEEAAFTLTVLSDVEGVELVEA